MLERLWRKNQAILRSIVLNILIDPSGVDDVLQEAYAKVLQSHKRFSTQEETYNYLRKTVLNTCIDYYRSCQRRNALFVNSCDTESSSLSHNQTDPLTHLLEKKKGEVRGTILEEVRKSLEELSPKQREAIEIIFNRNHGKVKDICKEKGIPYSTIRSRVTAGIDRIRRRLRVKGIYQSFDEVR